ncbi:T9SS type A sorting domain-containing protein [Dyadobacter sp. 676]|uniref:T9SS type A sorting domain-containing protein n=1 Tax=Dyadobacter sp. 676 TaxID=3088362 RepID=A0AAU8FMR8_9BACT
MKSSIGHLIRKLVGKKISGVMSAVILAGVSPDLANAQQYVASTSTTVHSETLATSDVLNPNNAVGAPDGQSATITASGLVVNIAIGSITYSSDAALHLNFSPALPAGKTTYVRISELTQTGLNLDLSSLLNVLGLLQNNTIRATSNGGATTQELVRDPAGNLYIAVTPTNTYSQVTVTLNFDNATASLIGLALGRITLSVEHATNYENTVFTPCEQAAFAFTAIDPHATGISLTLTDALQNPQNAIDGVVDANNFSLLQNGAITAASNVSQTVYLGKTIPGTNQIFAVVSKPAALANLAVLDNVTIQAYLGATPVGSAQSVRNLLLDLDLLTLFGNDGLAKIVFTPGGGEFDRIVIRSATILNANLFTGIRIHEIGARPAVSFTGGALAPGRVGQAMTSSLFGAQNFSIQCGQPGDYTYELYQVTAPGGRTMAGTLPSSVTLNPDGTFSGTPVTGEDGIFTFDVRATNQFGQTGITSFTMEIERALPVTLVSFKAMAEGQTASLAWTTSEETNSDRFEIERSQNGKNWTKIGSVASHKESSVTRHYSFVDPTPLNGDNLYRLKMVDLDETFSYSRIENLRFKGIALVYPNPVGGSENLTVNVGDWSKVKAVKVVNAAGKVVFEASNALLSGIQARNLVAGAYVIQVTNIDGSVSSQRFVRQ